MEKPHELDESLTMSILPGTLLALSPCLPMYLNCQRRIPFRWPHPPFPVPRCIFKKKPKMKSKWGSKNK